MIIFCNNEHSRTKRQNVVIARKGRFISMGFRIWQGMSKIESADRFETFCLPSESWISVEPGSLRRYHGQYTSLELQKKALEWCLTECASSARTSSATGRYHAFLIQNTPRRSTQLFNNRQTQAARRSYR
jgi:hypothetical protein